MPKMAPENPKEWQSQQHNDNAGQLQGILWPCCQFGTLAKTSVSLDKKGWGGVTGSGSAF